MKFFALRSILAAQHGNREFTEMARGNGDGAAQRDFQHGQRIPQTVKPHGREAKRGQMLLEINADAAEKNALAADVGLVGKSRRIKGDQRHIVPLRNQLRRQRVVT